MVDQEDQVVVQVQDVDLVDLVTHLRLLLLKEIQVEIQHQPLEVLEVVELLPLVILHQELLQEQAELERLIQLMHVEHLLQ